MALSIISNMAANTAHRTLTQSNAQATRSLAKLSSGKRVMGAQDDAASMAIGARLNSEVQALKTATTNASQANSMLQIAEGALSTTNAILVRMKSLSVQASSENLSKTERGFIFNEFASLRSEVDRIANDTEFNGSKLLVGSDKYKVGGLGGSLKAGNGFSSFKFSNNSALGTGDNPNGLEFSYDAARKSLRVLDAKTGAAQTITDINAPASGKTKDIYFGKFGLTITLNDQFTAANLGGLIGTPTTGTARTAGENAAVALGEIVNAAVDNNQSALGGATPTAPTTAEVTALQNAITAAARAAADADAAKTAIDAILNNTNTGQPAAEFGAADLTAIKNAATAGLTSDNVTGAIADLAASNALQVGRETGKDTEFRFKIGSGGVAAEDDLTFRLKTADAASLNQNMSALANFDNVDDAVNAIKYVGSAIDELQKARAAIGVSQNRLEFASQNLRSARENNEAARATLMDLDVAQEMTTFTSKQVLVQSGVAMMAQANQMPQNLLRLLQ